MSEQALARALAARLETERRDDPQGASTSSPGVGHGHELVDELAMLAEQLSALPRPPAPDASFRATLAARLAAAPPPSSLAASPVASSHEPPQATSRAASGTGAVPSTRDLSLALDDALSRLSLGASPVSLERGLGAAGAELSPLLDLAAALREAPETPSAAPEFRAELAARLAAAPAPRSLRPAAAPPGVGFLRRLWRSTAFTAAAAATIVLFLVAGVTYASADALPGAPLYPVKRTAERARLWLSTDAQAMALHMAFAELRLEEALAVPGRAGEALADFSREVTAALAGADAALAAGAQREAVAAPLLTWLVGARGHLIAQREGLPPTAWRVALAQVDAAIAALRGGRPLSERPVPRLADPVAVLALRADATFRRAWARAPLWPETIGTPGGGGGGANDESTAEARAMAVRGPVDTPDRVDASLRRGQGAAGVEAPIVPPPAAVDAPPPGGAAPPHGDAPEGGEKPPAPTEPAQIEPPTAEPRKTEKPSPAPPTATTEPTAIPPTTEPAPPASPSPVPEPTQTSAPIVPTEPPASPTPPPIVPTQAPPEPTTAPSPTATVAPVLPASIEVVCTPNTLLPAGRADCRIELAEAPPAEWQVEWVASLGTILWPHPEHDQDKRWARYEATNSLQGVEKVYATVHATLRDAAGNRVEGSTIIYIVPRLDELSQPPGDDRAPGGGDD